MRIRLSMDIDINRGGIAYATELHGKVLDALMDVFREEGIMPVDGLKMRELQPGEGRVRANGTAQKR